MNFRKAGALELHKKVHFNHVPPHQNVRRKNKCLDR